MRTAQYKILRELEDSEDGFDYSDDDDVADPTFTFETNEHESSDEDPEEPSDLENEIEAVSSVATTSISTELSSILTGTNPTVIASPSTSSAAALSTSKRVPRSNIIWKTKNLNLNEDQLRFHVSAQLPPEILLLDTPL